MVIQSQDVAMQGRRSFRQTSAVAYQQTRQPLTQLNLSNLSVGNSGSKSFLGTLNYYMDESGKVNRDGMPDNTFGDRKVETNGISGVTEEPVKNATRIQFETLSYLLHVFFLSGKRGFQQEIHDSTGMNLGQFSLGQPSFQVVSSEQLYTYEETETTSFSTQGKVMTSDGREISFQVDVGMSRSFYQEVYQKHVGLEPVMCDPLVINLDVGSAEVTDQKFYFDLDCDGKEDQISTLGAGSGFLALDLNGDGIINDGSELFGTSSGDGFYDLSKYDLDGNGWIDEADEVFDRLQIWVPSADGNGTCYKLKDKGVGAICLQNVSTDFTLQGENQQVNGAIRRSGVFLMESGQAGTIQHVDLAM